jgi:hypothetical protein
MNLLATRAEFRPGVGITVGGERTRARRSAKDGRPFMLRLRSLILQTWLSTTPEL